MSCIIGGKPFIEQLKHVAMTPVITSVIPTLMMKWGETFAASFGFGALRQARCARDPRPSAWVRHCVLR